MFGQGWREGYEGVCVCVKWNGAPRRYEVPQTCSTACGTTTMCMWRMYVDRAGVGLGGEGGVKVWAVMEGLGRSTLLRTCQHAPAVARVASAQPHPSVGRTVGVDV
eukprot:72056-Chlamydomonas_euryale.AAC.2